MVHPGEIDTISSEHVVSNGMAMARKALRTPVLLIAALCALLYANWILAIARFQPNVMFMDQWDYFLPLFNGQGWWARFTVQQGPVREGLGFVVTGWILEATAWDVRYDSLWVATALLLATGLALRLKWKLTGAIGLRDACIPVILLSLGQFETILSVPQASHSVVPLVLILLTANVWLSPKPALRYLAAGAIAFTLTFTGFGIIATAVISVLFVARVIRHARDCEYQSATIAAGGLAIVIVSWAMFRTNYVFLPAVEGFRFPWSPLTDYVRFIVLMLPLTTGHIGQRWRHYLSGSALATVVLAAAGHIAWVWVKHRPSLRNDVLVLVMGSGLAFVAATAIGRISLGVLAGTSPRYLTLLSLLWLALYLAAATSGRWMPSVAATLCVWMLAVSPYAWMPLRPLAEWPGTLGMTNRELEAMVVYGTSKAEWARAFLASGSWQAADAAVLFPMHPNPVASRFDDKLPFLRDHKLSFFAGQPERGDYLPWFGDDAVNCRSSDSSQPVCR
jgi:hypothetical protein